MSTDSRITILIVVFLILYLLIATRLFYWQIIKAARSQELAWDQYRISSEIPALRGDILSQDEFPLTNSRKSYLLFANLQQIKEDKKTITDKLLPILENNENIKSTIASESAKNPDKLAKIIKQQILEKLDNQELDWIPLAHNLTNVEKDTIQNLDFKGLDFQEEQTRFYPEASMAAHLLGFVGQDETGQNKGYFGLEGYYDLELKGRPGLVFQEKDANNNPILIGSFFNQEKRDGKKLVLHLDRSIQMIVEENLKLAIEKYGAKSGSVGIMDPSTGGIIAMASLPAYDPINYFQYDKALYKNSFIADTFEPGSIFKVFVMSSALDQGAVKPDTKCDICSEPYKIDKYTIKTWNDKYYPDTTMTEVIQHSDNVGMVFTGQKLGFDKFWLSLKNFGFGEKTNIDLQEEVDAPLKNKSDWNDVDLATAAFGQGIVVTGIQLLRATGALANGGKLVEPQVVKKIISGDKVIDIKPKIIKQVIKPETAKMMTEIMVNAVDKGESQWVKLKGYKIAGKTGTAQVAIAGHYDKEKTIASFLGFGPASKPKFVMLVSLREPQSSPWASETAAPLFFNIAKELMVYYGIQPD